VLFTDNKVVSQTIKFYPARRRKRKKVSVEAGRFLEVQAQQLAGSPTGMFIY
jgi:hypothetical protein